MTAPQVIVNPTSTSNDAPPLTDYNILRVIHMTREEWRAHCLHDMANIFQSAFDALEEAR